VWMCGCVCECVCVCVSVWVCVKALETVRGSLSLQMALQGGSVIYKYIKFLIYL